MSWTIDIPGRFDCGGSTIRVERVKKLHERVGDYQSHKNLIRIVASDPDTELQTFLHELFHAIFDRYGHPEQSDDEGIVEAAAQGLVQMLRTARD